MNYCNFTIGSRVRVVRAVLICAAIVSPVGSVTFATAQEDTSSEASDQSESEDVQTGEEAVVPSLDPGVPSKGESDAARRLREGKTLVVGPSNSRAGTAAKQTGAERQMSEIRNRQQGVAKRLKDLETEHRSAIETLAQALRNGNAGDQGAQEAVAQWQQQQQRIERERKTLQSQVQQLEAAAAHVATMALQQRQQEGATLPADATTKVYNLRHSRAPAMAQVLSNILDNKNVRMAVDERTNSLIVVAEKGTDDVVEALLMKLDQSVGTSAQNDQSGETLQLRIVWLLDGLTGEGKDPQAISMNPEVVDALHELGFEDPRVVCQQITTLTLSDEGRRGEFNFTVPVLINSQRWQLEGHGQIESMADERFNLKFDLGFQRVISNLGGGRGAGGEKAQVGGSIYTPLGHYTVMGTTTFVATNTTSTADGGQTTQQQQHLSAFVVYLDRAREFPAESVKEKQ